MTFRRAASKSFPALGVAAGYMALNGWLNHRPAETLTGVALAIALGLAIAILYRNEKRNSQ
jgi:hypothetical protein